MLKNRRGLYALIDRLDMVAGRVIGHHEGFGFLVPDQGGDDLFLSPREMRLVLHGDRAVARVAGLDQRGRKEGSIIEVLERSHKTVVGRYVAENNVNILVASDKRITQDILIPHDAIGDARPNQIVVAEIIEIRRAAASRSGASSRCSATTWRRAWKSRSLSAPTICRTSGRTRC